MMRCVMFHISLHAEKLTWHCKGKWGHWRAQWLATLDFPGAQQGYSRYLQGARAPAGSWRAQRSVDGIWRNVLTIPGWFPHWLCQNGPSAHHFPLKLAQQLQTLAHIADNIRTSQRSYMHRALMLVSKREESLTNRGNDVQVQNPFLIVLDFRPECMIINLNHLCHRERGEHQEQRDMEPTHLV